MVHPLKVLRPNVEMNRLLSFRAKVLRLKGLGIETIFSIRFNKKLSLFTAEEFVENVLISSLEAKHIINCENSRWYSVLLPSGESRWIYKRLAEYDKLVFGKTNGCPNEYL